MTSPADGPVFVVGGKRPYVVASAAEFLADRDEPCSFDGSFIDSTGRKFQVDAHHVEAAEPPDPAFLRELLTARLEKLGLTAPAAADISEFSRLAGAAIVQAERERAHRTRRTALGVLANGAVALVLVVVAVINASNGQWIHVALATIVLLGQGVSPAVSAHRAGELYFTRQH